VKYEKWRKKLDEYMLSRKEKYPKKHEFVIYSTIPRGYPYYIRADGDFIPVFDSTDHFHFACSRCKEIACVVMVRRHDSYADTPTIYFYLKCPKCGAEGQRKIYLENEKGMFLLFPVRSHPLPAFHEGLIQSDKELAEKEVDR